jgi:hypothetical protein
MPKTRAETCLAISLVAAVLLGPGLGRAGVAYDDAAHPDYADGWQSGDNGGVGFGPWTLRGGTSTYFFVESSRHNGFRSLPTIDSSGSAWGLWAQVGLGDGVAFRSFNDSLTVDDVVRFQLDTGFVESGTGRLVGVNFRYGHDDSSTTSRVTGARLEIFFRGGMNTYSVVDAAGERDTGVRFSDAGISLACTFTGAGGYELAIWRGGATALTAVVTGQLAGATGTNQVGVDSVAFYNLGTAVDYRHDLFFNRLSVNQAYALAPTGTVMTWEQVHGAAVESRRVNAFYTGGLTEAQPVLGDLDGDGDQDLLVGTAISTNPQVGRVLFYRNIGSARSPRWERPEELQVVQTNAQGEVSATVALDLAMPAPALGDLDGDGDLDLLVGVRDGPVAHLVNTGSRNRPQWEMRNANLLFSQFYPAPALADIDADGDLDLFVGHAVLSLGLWEDGLSFFRNTGNSNSFSFIYQQEEFGSQILFERSQLSPHLADLDADGDFDVLSGREAFSHLQYRANTGGVTGQYWGTAQAGYQNLTLPSPSPFLADTDADGDLDLFLGGREDLQVMENVGSPAAPSFQWSPAYSQFGVVADVGINSAPALVDLDGDGDADLLVAEAGGNLNLFRNIGSPTTPVWSSPEQSYLSVGDASLIPTCGDLDGDGDPDLLVGHWMGSRDGTLTMKRNTGTVNQAAWGGEVTNYAGLHLVAPVTPALGDLDGDGDLDLVVGDGHGVLHYVQNTGTVTVAAWAPAVAAFPGIDFKFQIHPVLADFDLDGDLDLGAGEPGAFFTIFPNTGTVGAAAWGSPVTLQMDHGVRSFFPLASADMDGDGDPDLLAGQDSGGLLHLRNGLPRLALSPVSTSVAELESVPFTSAGTTNALTWALVQNRSGGSINSSNGLYEAGTNAPALDVVRAVDSHGVAGLAYVNVIAPEDIAAAGKAIILAGGKSLSDPVWPATHFLADQAYLSLLFKGFSKSTVQYLSFGPDEDVDGNGLLDDVDGATTLAAAAAAFTNWVGPVSKLFVYLVDHGEQASGHGYFRLNSGELLGSAQLAAWLNALQSNQACEVTLVLDFCYAGSFLADLALPAPPLVAAKQDSALAPAYADGWQAGDTGGVGFTSWQLRSTGNAGFFTGSSANNGAPGSPHIDTNGVAWGLYANNGGQAVAYRGVTSPVSVEADFQVAMDNGWIDTGQSVGVVFRHGNSDANPAQYNVGARLEFFFLGGASDYTVVDRQGTRATGVAYTDRG